MNLVIVESPTKAKTISKMLGSRKYKVLSSYGHVRDLPQKELGVETSGNFKATYVVPDRARKNLKELKTFVGKSDLIILATDEDREGEAISWHLVEALKLKNKKTNRIVFHEITKPAIEKALANPREIDMNLVDAQQARRILDRLVGYKLSPFLWRKIRKGLSAGRVQSVAVRLIVEREREIKKFKSEEYWEIGTDLEDKSKNKFLAKLWKEEDGILKKMDVKNKKQANKIKNNLEKSKYKIEKITKKETSKNPPAPFTTSGLQQAANSFFGYSTKQTMRIAQQLYEGISLENKKSVGLITYMRTDSLNLSSQALKSAKKEIEKKFGKKYTLEKPRFYKTKSKGAQEAHEAIRPTFLEKDPEVIKQYLDPKQYKLYNLIWRRTIACQMAAAISDSTTAAISAKTKTSDYTMKAHGSIIKFDGYLKLIGKNTEDNLLPNLKEKETLSLIDIQTDQKFTQPPARYSEAVLVKALEENGIGRPSTYAPTISTIQDRGYIEKDENRKLFPTEIAFLVNDLLVKHFKEIIDYEFTADMENDLDKVAEGKKKWQKVLEGFYKPFKENLVKKGKEIKKEDFQTKLNRKCPECGSGLVEKFGRFGKFIACTKYPDCKYTEKSAEDKKVEKEVLKSEGNEKGEILCDKCGAKMDIKNGPYGMFLGCSKYPDCKNIKRIENKTGVKCPECGKDIAERKSKKGRVFYGCTGYPKCKFALWSKPTGETCPKCKSLLIYGAKNTARCSNKECKFSKSLE